MTNDLNAAKSFHERGEPALSLLKDVRRGVEFIDQETGLKVEVKEISINKEVSLLIKFPNKDKSTAISAKAGQQWVFQLGTKAFILTLVNVYYIADSIEISVRPALLGAD